MTLLLALALPAQAQGLLASDYMLCLDQQVWETVPAAGAVGVPLDAQPGVIFSHGDCATDKTFLLSLIAQREGGETLVLEQSFDSPADAPRPWAPLALDAPLEPFTGYVLRVESLDGFGGLVEIGFETGEGSAQGHGDAPTLETLTQTWGRQRRQLFRDLFADMMPAEDPDEMGTVLLRDADAPELHYAARAAHGERLSVSVPLAPVANPDPVCAELVQLDAAGREAGQSEVRCAEGERAGCSTTGAGGSLLLALGAMLGGIRRRRRS